MLDAVRWVPAHHDDSPLPGKLRLIDQTRLPGELAYIETDDLSAVHDAIRRLVVRGAPAIGCAAALGLAADTQHFSTTDPRAYCDHVEECARFLETARPTAVNLFWALRRCVGCVKQGVDAGTDDVSSLKRMLVEEALAILREDMELCRGIGCQGVELFENTAGKGVLTHCNAGALATSDYGTALSPIYLAHERGLDPRVFADETRPLLQGARLTAWELQRAGVDVTLICDSMAAQVMREGRIDLVIVGADRIAANGDVANKIGTYAVAVAAKYHGIPFYVAAPYSTIDLDVSTGAEIPIEQRAPEEITFGFGKQTAPAGCSVYNPAFDVTPHELVDGIITERAILRTPFGEAISNYRHW